MTQGHHVIQKHVHTKNNFFLRAMDKGMYIVALIAPIMTIPQVVQVYQHHVTGVSIATWAAYAFASLLWVIYGTLHNDKQLVLMQFLLLVFDAAIVVGVILYR